MRKYKTNFSKEELHKALHSKNAEAAEIIENPTKWANFKAKFEAFLKKAEKIPVLGRMMDDIVTMFALVDSYVKGEYRGIPLGAVISIVAALTYVISPIDLIPDVIPAIGYLDDAAVLLAVLDLGVSKDLDKYKKWQEKNRQEALKKFEELFAEELMNIIGESYLAAVVVCGDMKIKLLLSEEQDAIKPIECKIKVINVPVKNLGEFDICKMEDIVKVINDASTSDDVKWINEADKKAFYEPGFESRWDDYIVEEGDE